MSKKLLLVERSLAIQKLVELALSKEEIEVITVTNGLSALDILSEVPPDLLVVDSQMEGMNIQTFLEKMKAGVSVSHPPVLLLTEPEDLVEPEALRASGVWGCIEKPLEAALLRSRVVDILQSAPATPPIVDPEETIVGPLSTGPTHSPSSAPQGEEEMMKIEDLLGWSSDEKSPFSELEEEKSSDDLSFPLEDAKGQPKEAGGAVVVDEEAVVFESVDLLQDKQESPIPVSEMESVSPAPVPSSPDPETPSLQERSVIEEPTGVQEQPIAQEQPSIQEAPSSEAVVPPSPKELGEIPELTPEQMEPILSKISREIIEKVAWEVVPSLAESVVRTEAVVSPSPKEVGEIPELSPKQMEVILSKISREIIEKVVWEVVPSLAEIAVQKEIERLKAEDPS